MVLALLDGWPSRAACLNWADFMLVPRQMPIVPLILHAGLMLWGGGLVAGRRAAVRSSEEIPE